MNPPNYYVKVDQIHMNTHVQTTKKQLKREE